MEGGMNIKDPFIKRAGNRSPIEPWRNLFSALFRKNHAPMVEPMAQYELLGKNQYRKLPSYSQCLDFEGRGVKKLFCQDFPIP